MYSPRSRGFTLIELLVVIAIIGILSAVVLASLNSARTKGGDAAVAANLNTVQTQAEIYYNNVGSYGPAFAVANCPTVNTDTSMFYLDVNIRSAIAQAKQQGGGTAASVKCAAAAGTAPAYAVSALLKSSATYMCVDSTGVVSTSSAALTGTTCP